MTAVIDYSGRVLGAIAALAMVAVLAGCAPEPVAPVQECEPGVAEISEMGTVLPPNC